MSRFIQDTESIENFLDHIESKLADKNNNILANENNNIIEGSQGVRRYNYTKDKRIRSQANNHLITELFKKILEAESSYRYMDKIEFPVMSHNINEVQHNDSGKNVSSTLDMIEEMSESLKNVPIKESGNKPANDKGSGKGFDKKTGTIFVANSTSERDEMWQNTNDNKNYGLSEAFIPSPMKHKEK